MDHRIESMRRKLNGLAESSASSQEYRAALIEQLRRIVAFDGACCTAVDPQTLLSTGAVTEQGVEAIHNSLFEYEYLREDFIPYDQLVKADRPVATLSGATDGQPTRSARCRNVLLPGGFHDEMRAALVYKGSCWGYLTLYRHLDQPLFDEEERGILLALVPLIAGHLRKLSFAFPSEDLKELEEQPGIIVLTDGLAVLSSNAAADCWLSLLRAWEDVASPTLPRPIRAVCYRALSEAGAGRSPVSKVCMRMPDSPYVTIQASLLRGAADSVQLAVWIEPAKPADTLPLFSEAYALSERERQILDHIFQGLSTKELAQSLHISAYTVQDHLKSIFLKTGVTSRRELIWHFFSRFTGGKS